MSFTVIIPARLKSSRLPDKPLADICGRPMIVRVAERALSCGGGQGRRGGGRCVRLRGLRSRRP